MFVLGTGVILRPIHFFFFIYRFSPQLIKLRNTSYSWFLSIIIRIHFSQKHILFKKLRIKKKHGHGI